MKLAVFGITSSLLFALVMNSKAEAATLFDFPTVTPDPHPLQLLGPGGEELTFIKTGEDTGGRYTLTDFILQPGSGSPLHIHHREDEWFYVSEGNVQMEMGDNTYPDINVIPGINAPKEHLHVLNATPGTLIYAPRYHVHGFQNVGTTPVRMKSVWAPSNLDNLFKEVSPPLSDPSKPPPIDIRSAEAAKSEFLKYGINLSTYPGEYVDTVDNNFPEMDNNANELLALLNENPTSVPEPSSQLGMLAFGALGVSLMLKRKWKSVSRVRQSARLCGKNRR